jgi:predicted PurR-regulated permease PerM
LTVLLALGVLGAVGYKLGQQLTTLAMHLDRERLEQNVRNKMGFLGPKNAGVFRKLSTVGEDLARALGEPKTIPDTVPVTVVSQPSFRERLQTAVGPFLEYAGVGMFVLILVLFILANREDLSDRIIRLFGQRRVSLTTKTMDEAGQRISRYLMMFATVNSSMGLIIGLGLWAIGIPLATLWGVLMALFRFIPYVGPAVAFVLPLLFTVANFPGWREPLMVIALFAVVETMANSFLEPVIYGKTTGVSALGLLVAAMFWTWLWGALGLFLSTPMTVCLAVVGKYVTALRFFATMLGEDPPLEPDVRFYQRLLAMDQDGAEQIIEAELKQHPRAEVFDTILIPTLSRCERDHGRDEIEDREQAFIQRFIGDLLDELETTPEVDLKSLAPPSVPGQPEVARLLGVMANDHSDVLALRMLSLLLQPAGLGIRIMDEEESPLKLAEQIAGLDPQMVILSHLPPGGFTTARYLVRRLRAQFAELPIMVGRWGERGDAAAAAERMTSVGATCVVFRLADARDQVLERLRPKPEQELSSPPLATSAASSA